MSQKPEKLLAACIQLCSGRSVDRNLSICDELIRKAADAGASFICTPEMTPLFEKNRSNLLENTYYEREDKSLKHFQKLARELGVTLVIGSIAIKANSTHCYNRSYCIDPQGEIAARYDKIHLFDAIAGDEVHRESSSYIAGDQAVVANVSGLKIGMSICYDLRFPKLFNDLATARSQIITVPAAFTQTTGEAHWHTLLRARAIETNCFILAPAQSGTHEDGRKTFGRSLIVSPWGEVLCDAEIESGFCLANIDLAKIDTIRARLPNLQNQASYKPPVTAE